MNDLCHRQVMKLFPANPGLDGSSDKTARDPAAQQKRLELARQAFRQFSTQCFWSWSEETEISEETIPFIVKGLRLHGGHAGYRMAAELCR